MPRRPCTILLYNETYDQQFFICLGTTYEQAQKKWQETLLKSKFLTPAERKEVEAMEIEISRPRTNARTMFFAKINFPCIWFPKRAPTPDIVAHECLHLTHWLLKEKGLRLTDDSEEAYTYLLQWFVKEIYREIL